MTYMKYSNANKIARFVIKILFLLLSPIVLQGQEEYCECPGEKERNKLMEEKLLTKHYQEIFPGITNHYFMYWAKGNVVLEDGSIITNENIRLDMYQNELLWLREGDFVTGMIEKGIIYSFNFKDPKSNKRVFFKKVEMLPGENLFLRVLVEGKVSIYVHHGARSYNNMSEIDPFSYYYLKKDGKLRKIRVGKRSLYKAMGKEKEKMKKLLKENGIRLKNEENLVEIIKKYNEQE